MKNNRKSLFAISTLYCLALVVPAGVMANLNNTNKAAKANNPSSNYSLYFDATNNVFNGSTNKTVATTTDGNEVSFSYTHFVESTGNWAESQEGSIASFFNAYDVTSTYHNALSGLLSIKVNYTGAQVYLDYGWGEDYKAEALSYSRKGVKLASDTVFSFESVLESPEFLNIRTSNTATTIESITITYACSEGDYRDVYTISSKEELLGFKHLVESGASATPAVLTADIDLAGMEFEPIGNSANLFHSVFDGNNHKISNLTISSSCTTKYVGLFYAIGTGTTVKDLYLEDVNINVANTATRVAALAGYCNGNKSVIDNVMVSGSITSSASEGTGAIFGHGEGTVEGNTIRNCVNKATIASTLKTSLVGGMVGAIAEGKDNPHHLTISSCVNYGELKGTDYVGGIVGLIRSIKAEAGVHTIVEGCENYGNVLGTGANVGGIVGRFRSGEVNDCRVGGKVTIKTYTKIDSLNTVGTTPEVMGTVNVGAVCGAAETISGSHVPTFRNLVACWAGGTGSNKFTSGTGTEADPYIITRAYQYFWLRTQTNTNKETFAGQYIVLGNDIDFDYIEGSEYACNTNIADLAGGTISNTFSGTFNGNNHEIRNMHVSRTGVAAMFGEPINATFKNMTFSGCSFTTSNQRAAHVAARAQGCTFENINVLNGSASGKKQIGGIAGFALGTNSFTNCSNGATLSMNTGDDTSSSVGGILSATHTTAEHITFTGCENKGEITGTGSAGGILGCSFINASGEVIIEQCDNNGTVISVSGEGVGGILGRIEGVGPVSLSQCVNSGDVLKTAGLGTGGIVGANVNNASFTIDNCDNYGEIHGLTFVGGIMGIARTAAGSSITYCLGAGDIYATATANSSFIVGCNRITVTGCDVLKTAKAYVGDDFVLASSLPAPLTTASNVRTFVYGQQTDNGTCSECSLIDIWLSAATNYEFGKRICGAYSRLLDLNNGTALLTDNGMYCLINGHLEFEGNSWAKINNGEDVATIDGVVTALNNANYQTHLLNDGRVITLYRSDYSDYLYSSIRLRYFDLSSKTWSNPYILVENYAGSSGKGGLYEPFGVEYENNKLKVFFSCDAKSSISHGSIMAHPEILLTGTALSENWQNTISFDLDLSSSQPSVSNIHIVPHISGCNDIKRPGMTSVTKLHDGSYAMVMECLRPYESNSSYDYSGFIGISYSHDLVNWTDMAPLIYPSKKGLHGGTGPNKYQNGAPYIVSLPNGMIAVSYMTDVTLESDYYFTAGAPSGTRTRYRRVEYRVSKTIVSYGDSNIDMTNYEGTRNYAKNEGSRFGGIAFFDNKLIVMSGRYELTGNDSATVNASKYLYMTYHQYLG